MDGWMATSQTTALHGTSLNQHFQLQQDTQCYPGFALSCAQLEPSRPADGYPDFTIHVGVECSLKTMTSPKIWSSYLNCALLTMHTLGFPCPVNLLLAYHVKFCKQNPLVLQV